MTTTERTPHTEPGAEEHDRARQRTAERLLASSAKLSFDPLKDVDWSSGPEPGRYYGPPKRLSLYGTSLWDGLTEDQRIELSKHEVASVASVGIWFEEILMQMLLRHAFDRDPTTAHVQYALTEIADECRHSVMFARMISWMGVPAYGPGKVAHELGRIFKAVSTHSQTFGGTMYVEEILDAFQREMMNDDSLQPLTRQVSRIHVIEESRHISYAREELQRKHLGPVRRCWEQLTLGVIIYFSTTRLIHPRLYAAVGVDPREGRKVARRNPYWHTTRREMAAKVIGVLDQAGLVGRTNRWLLRAAGVL
ncbi:diiron oxygenase [Kitasatospora atroaurantiaca]|uniref:Para-aminobenzoate N-oxygenase AurF n=1 Tax=Kitasatospora atroaurantiaca TaxID=285545 RepID=A0A561EI95_9ACTN|nr:diiron oxygenase [Kitasatospora atroaurantiaca]TWE15339.1 para-aminobenzoate N-oxygenase AurF [Kitasatospora atroaurantiaca]